MSLYENENQSTVSYESQVEIARKDKNVPSNPNVIDPCTEFHTGAMCTPSHSVIYCAEQKAEKREEGEDELGCVGSG